LKIFLTKNFSKISLNNTRLLLSKTYKDYNSNSRSLVIYGSNLGSTLGMTRLPNNLRNLIYLTSLNYSIIEGHLLSDGWLEKYSSNSNTSFRFKQSIDKSLYVLTSYFYLSHYCSRIPYILKSNRKGKVLYALEFSTRYLSCLNELYLLFYKDKVKVIPNIIYDLLTPVALAHWIMGDGAILNKGVVLCIDSCSLQDVIKLVNVLKLKYDLNCTIQGINNKRPRIYILPESLPKLINIVRPYFLSSMLYKLHL
jgi:hypothetical protein